MKWAVRKKGEKWAVFLVQKHCEYFGEVVCYGTGAVFLAQKAANGQLRTSMTAGKKRTVKVFVWRILSITITLVITFFMTGNLIEASSLTVILHAVLMAAHWLFEIGWDRHVL